MAGARIMIVEDEKIVARDLKERLGHMGHEVSSMVLSGEQAVKQAGDVMPDLILMDIRLKGKMDGVDTARTIHSRFNIPIVYLTAYADEDTVKRARVAEPFGYILKPFGDRELRSIIEIALYKHAMERKLREREKWFRTTLESIGEAVITTDESDRIIFMNPLAESITGWSFQKARGAFSGDVLRIKKKGECLFCTGGMEKVLRDGESVQILDHSLLTRSGREIPIEDNITPIWDAPVESPEYGGDGKDMTEDEISVDVSNKEGKILGCVHVFRDISDRKRIENELLRAMKLESLSTLAAGLAHDFNNLLTVIYGNISLARDRMKQFEREHAMLGNAELACERARDLVQTYMTFAVGDDPVKEKSSLVALVDNAAKLALGDSKIECDLLPADDLGFVEVDRSQISHALHNIISNARDAMPEGGRLKIMLYNVTISQGNRLNMQDGDYVKVSVKDYGQGIPPENQYKIFDPYFSTKKMGSRKGMGFGLSVSYAIIKNHDGFIDFDSAPGKGATFNVYLPAM